MEKLSHLPHVKEVRGQGLLVGVEFDDSISGVEAKHLRYTGSSNRGILENLRKLSKKGADIWIRIPVIGSVNDTEEEIGRIGTFLRDYQIHMSQVNLLPYHDTGSSKYQRLSIQYGGGDFYTPSDERMQELKMLMETYVNVPVLIGG